MPKAKKPKAVFDRQYTTLSGNVNRRYELRDADGKPLGWFEVRMRTGRSGPYEHTQREATALATAEAIARAERCRTDKSRG